MGILTSPSQLNPAYFKKTPKRGLVTTDLKVTLGSSAIASQASDHPDIAATRTGAGVYTLTYPPSVSGKLYVTEIYSPLLTVLSWAVTAKNIGAGTATLKVTNAAGSATDPASGDTFTLTLELNSEV